MPSSWPRPTFYLVIALSIFVDQLTKWWATVSLAPLRSVVLVPGFFNLTYLHNTGIAFGMFAGEGMVVGVVVMAVAAIALYQTRSLDWSGWEPNLVGGALVGGALGNLLDRARLGYVVDFFDAHAGPHHWPVFNVADSLICCAVAWIVVRQLRAKN